MRLKYESVMSGKVRVDLAKSGNNKKRAGLFDGTGVTRGDECKWSSAFDAVNDNAVYGAFDNDWTSVDPLVRAMRSSIHCKS